VASDVAGVTGAPQPDLRLIKAFGDLCQFGKEWFDIMPRMARFQTKSRPGAAVPAWRRGPA
jgi:hypothetical protein